MQSLADYLGIPSPLTPSAPVGPPPGPLTAKKFCQAILNSGEFRTYILNGIVLGTLPPQILMRVMDHGWGKVPDKIEMKDLSGPLETATAEALEQRALVLADKARRLRAMEQEPQGPVQ